MRKVLCLLLIALAIFSFASCKNEPKHEHSFGTTKQFVKQSDGTYKYGYSCSCGAVNECEVAVGDTGPAGGIIFYIKDSYSDGWRYLEAAPANLKVVRGVPTVDSSLEEYSSTNTAITSVSFVSGFYRKADDGENLYVNGTTTYASSDCTGTGIGTGKNNTALLAEKMGTSIYRDQTGNVKLDRTVAARDCEDLEYNGFGDWFLPSKDELNLLYENLKKADLGDFGTGRFWSSSEDNATPEKMCYQVFDDNGSQGTMARQIAYAVRPIRQF